MMYPRLFLARNLLKEDGVIFISIDDHEVSNLRKIADDILGRCNGAKEDLAANCNGITPSIGEEIETCVTRANYQNAIKQKDPASLEFHRDDRDKMNQKWEITGDDLKIVK